MKLSLQRKPRLGLALSGGGARGLAHIGVLKALHRAGVAIDYLSGTSMGGVIAAGYAAGMSPDDLEKEALEATHTRRLLRLADPGLPNGSLLRGQRLQVYFKRHFAQLTFADLHIPLSVVAVDLNTRQEVILDKGPLALALQATTAVPGLLLPVETNGWRLVDGGLLNNLPVGAVRAMGAEVVVAVDIGLKREAGIGRWIGRQRWVPGGLAVTLEILDDTLGTLMTAAQEQKLREFPPDVLIQPDLPDNINLFTGYGQAARLIQSGELAGEAAFPIILSLLKPARRRPFPVWRRDGRSCAVASAEKVMTKPQKTLAQPGKPMP